MKRYIMFFIMFAFILFTMLFLFGCDSEKNDNFSNRPPTCFDAHEIFKGSKGFITGTKNSLISMITTSFNRCWKKEDEKLERKQKEKKIKARKEIIATCMKVIYPIKQLTKEEDKSRYIEFLECMNKLENVK